MSNMCTSSPHSFYSMVKTMALRQGRPSPLTGFTSFLGSSGGVPTALWVTDWPLTKLADIHIERCYITRKRMGSRREWILTNQRTGNSHCGTVMDAFSRERILALNKRECIYSCPNVTSKPELSLQVRTRNLKCLGSNWHALRAWVWGLIAPKLARKTCQLTSRIDPRHKQTRLANVKVLKYKLPPEFNMIPNVQLMTKRPAENTPRKSRIS